MPYDTSKKYLIPFIGGPFDGKSFAVQPASRLGWKQLAPDGAFIKEHFYHLRESVDDKTGEILKLEYIHQA